MRVTFFKVEINGHHPALIDECSITEAIKGHYLRDNIDHSPLQSLAAHGPYTAAGYGQQL